MMNSGLLKWTHQGEEISDEEHRSLDDNDADRS
jgi:hypothetical protein